KIPKVRLRGRDAPESELASFDRLCHVARGLAFFSQGSVRKMDMVLVQGKMIRYVHIPDEVDAMQNLQKHV
ncbi:unnamed protein product, partial [Hapterophycus canaliculatus]